MIEWVNHDLQNNLYVKILHIFHMTISYNKCKFEKIHQMLITVDKILWFAIGIPKNSYY